MTYDEWIRHDGITGQKPKIDMRRLPSLWGLPVSSLFLCARFGVTRATLYRHANKMGLPPRGRGKRFDLIEG